MKPNPALLAHTLEHFAYVLLTDPSASIFGPVELPRRVYVSVDDVYTESEWRKLNLVPEAKLIRLEDENSDELFYFAMDALANAEVLPDNKLLLKDPEGSAWTLQFVMTEVAVLTAMGTGQALTKLAQRLIAAVDDRPALNAELAEIERAAVEEAERDLLKVGFTREKPTEPGAYTWAVPRAEEAGYNMLPVELTCTGSGILMIECEEAFGDTFGPVMDTTDTCLWRKCE